MIGKSKKNEFRTKSLKHLRKLTKSSNLKKDIEISNNIYRYIKEHKAQNIMLYVPMDLEVNLFGLINKLRKENKRVFVPYMTGVSFRLVEYRLPLKTKQFNIKEPNGSAVRVMPNIDVAIVPVVGIDETFRRVGFGKGMYDRFFEKNSQNIKKIAFVSRDLCFSNDIITDSHDVLADIIFTSKKVYI